MHVKMVSGNFVCIKCTTHAVQFTPHKVHYYPLNLPYADQIVVETDTVKFQGLQLDSHLTWKIHINSLPHSFIHSFIYYAFS